MKNEFKENNPSKKRGLANVRALHKNLEMELDSEKKKIGEFPSENCHP